MTRIYAFLTALALAGLLSSCGITGPVPPPGTPGISNCSNTALHDAELRLLPSIESALASGGWEAALLSIIAQEATPLAADEVNCLVAYVLSKAEVSVTASDPLEVTKAEHAKAWLAKHPVAVN